MEIDMEELRNLTRTNHTSLPSGGLVVSRSGIPEWEEVMTQHKWLFLLHCYSFACSFLVLTFFTFFSILNIRSLITTRPYMSSINIFLCTVGATRSAVLFIDPYHLKMTLPRAIGSVVWDTSLASLVSAFCLLQLALLQVTQLRTDLPRLFKSKSHLTVVIMLHFSCFIAVDLSLAVNPSLVYVKYVVDTIVLLWGLTLSGTFLYASHRAIVVLKNMPVAMLERDVEVQHKGVMQLSILAPYNNLATSVAAALVPTLLAPKLVSRHSPNVNGNNTKQEGRSCVVRQPVSKQNSETTDVNSDNDETKVFLEVKDNKVKKLSWSPEQKPNSFKRGLKTKLSTDEDTEGADSGIDSRLLPPTKSEGTLQVLLAHIAQANGTASRELGETGIARRAQLAVVLRIALATAVLLGVLLIMNLLLLYVPKGILWCGVRSWLGFHTTCRALESLVAWAIAALTRQPVAAERSLHYSLPHHSKPGMFM